MISTVLIYLLNFVLKMVNLLPDYKIPDNIIDSGVWIIDLSLAVNPLFFNRISYIYIAFFSIISFELILWALRGALSIINWFRGSGNLNFN